MKKALIVTFWLCLSVYSWATVDQSQVHAEDYAIESPNGKVSAMMALADETRLKLGEFGVRGSEQRPIGTLFPGVPILSNQVQNWDILSDAEKGRAKTEFKAGFSTDSKTKR